MTGRPSFFVRIFGPVAVVALGLVLGGCMHTLDHIVEAVMPERQSTAPATASTTDIIPVQIAAIEDLPDMQTASGGGPGHDDAISHIERLGDDVLATMEIGLVDGRERDGIFRAILARDLDIELIARFVLGQHWNDATIDQRNRYSSAFSAFLVQTYATRLGGVHIDRFEVQEARSIGDKDVLVRSKVDHGARKPVRADWRVRDGAGGFKIIDLSVAGISMALMLREEFASILRKQGLDGLITMLQDRNA